MHGMHTRLWLLILLRFATCLFCFNMLRWSSLATLSISLPAFEGSGNQLHGRHLTSIVARKTKGMSLFEWGRSDSYKMRLGMMNRMSETAKSENHTRLVFWIVLWVSKLFPFLHDSSLFTKHPWYSVQKWEKEEAQRIEQQSELLRYMRRLVEEDRRRWVSVVQARSGR